MFACRNIFPHAAESLYKMYTSWEESFWLPNINFQIYHKEKCYALWMQLCILLSHIFQPSIDQFIISIFSQNVLKIVQKGR